LVQLCVRVEQQLKRIAISKRDYLNTSYSWKDSKRGGYPSKSKYEGSKGKKKEKAKIKR